MAALMTNLVYYASVVRDQVVLVSHQNGKEDMVEGADDCVANVPPFHNRFAYTIRQRMFIFLMEDSFMYTAIVDEALGKLKGFGFLERVRDEFQLMLRSRGLDASRLERNAMMADFGGVFKLLVKPLIGVPQKEVDLDEDHLSDSKDHTALSPQDGSPSHHAHSGNLNGTAKPEKKSKKDEQGTKMKEIMMTNSGKSLKYEGGNSSSDMENGMARKRCNARNVASKMWWRNVKRVLILDLVVCCVLFAIWLGICRGFSCVKN